MVSSQVGIGQWNSQLRLTLNQKSQNVGANTSSVECVVEVYNGGTAPAFSGSGVNWSLSGDVSKGTASGPLNVPAKSWRTVGTFTANVAHGSDGVKRATVTATLGSTPTATFGNGGSVTTSINLTRIPKAPAKSGKPTVNNVSSSGARGNLGSAPNDNGSAITRYEWLREGGSWVNGSTSRSYNFTGLAANSNYRVKVRARNAVGVGPESDWSNTFTTAPNAPAAVTNAKVVRVSDSAQDLSWTRNPTAPAPYSSIQIERRDTVNGTRVRIATLAGTATSYRDGATVAGRRYDYYIRPVNAGGDGPWSAGLGVNTTPPAPNNVDAVKDGAAIDVTWNRVATQWGVVNHVVQDNPGGTGWVTVATVGDVGSWTHVAPDTSKTHQYRVRTVVYLYNATDAGRLSSVDSKPSGLVQLLAAPLAPSLLGPAGTVDRDLPVVFVWKHNPVDTTKQTAFELRYRLAGNPWTETSGTAAQTLTIPALGVTGNVEWQVRTKGQFASFGSWSAVASFGLGGAPTVAINSPVSGTLPQSRVTVTWGYYQPDSVAQTSWRAVLTDGLTGTPIQTLTGSGTATTATFTRLLTDATEYGLEVTVTAANGITATDTVSFTTDFPLPVTVEPVPNWDRDTGSVSLTFTDAPTPALYAWAGVKDGSVSTKTTAAGVLTNLATNPSFEATAGTVEVRRNLHPTPLAAGTVSPDGVVATAAAYKIGATTAGTYEVAAGWQTLKPTTIPVGGRFGTRTSRTLSTPAPIGSTLQFSTNIPTSAPSGLRWRLYVDLQHSGGGTQSTSIFRSTSGILSTSLVATGIVTAVVFLVWLEPGEGSGDWTGVYAGRYGWNLIEVSRTLQSSFNGTAQLAPDTDLTASWVGAANNSESILTGQRVAGVSTTGGVAIRSAQWLKHGAYSVRLIATTQSQCFMQITGVPSGTKTAKITRYQDQVLTYTPDSGVLNQNTVYFIGSPVAYSNKAPNEIGESDLTVVGHSTSGNLVLYGGQSTGQSVWFDGLTIVEGVYDGPYFDGSTQSTVAAETLDLQRQIGDGPWITLAEDLALTDAVTDPIPATNGVNRYRAISRTSLPTEAIGEEVEFNPNEKQWLYFNHGSGWGQVVRFMGNPAVAQNTGRNSAVHAMAGIPYPTSVRGSQLNAHYEVGGVITPDGSQRTDWENLSNTETVVCYRDPANRRVFANINPIPLEGTIIENIGASFDRVHYIEGLLDEES